MSVPYRMIDIKTSDEAFKSIIIKYFDDFKKFIKVPDLQCPPINLVDKFDDLTCAHVKNGVLEVSKLYFIALKQGAVSVLYHEFTHVYDDYMIKPLNKIEELGLNIYTEYHASVVQMMTATGFNSYYKDKQISITSRIRDALDDRITKDYLEKQHRLNSELYIDTTNIGESFKNARKQMFYYIGKMYFAQKYIKEDTTELLSLETFINIFGENVITLKDVLFLNDYSNNVLTQLAKTQDTIMCEFEDKFGITNQPNQ